MENPLHCIKRALCLSERTLFSIKKSPMFKGMDPILNQKNPILKWKNPILYHKSPMFKWKDPILY